MKKLSLNERIVKDLSFLLAFQPQNIKFGITKRVQVSGTGDKISDIKVPCSIYFSLIKYSYEGRYISHDLHKCIRDVNKRGGQFPEGLYTSIETMRLYQKSWFNIKSSELHQVQNLGSQGCHFFVEVEEIKYKNSDTMEAKRIVSEQSRVEGKKSFVNGEYQKALKCYRKQINISEGIEKKKYSEEELKQLKEINEKGKKNFIKCFIKLNNFEDTISDLADKYSKQLLKLNDQDGSLRYLRGRVLLMRKYVTTAEQIGIQLERQGIPVGKQLLDQIAKVKTKN